MPDTIRNIILTFDYVTLTYFLVIGSVYLLLNIMAFIRITNYKRRNSERQLKDVFRLRNFQSISIIVPAYNESAGILDSVKSILQLEYPSYQVIVVNDGSKDNMLEKLIDGFSLKNTGALSLNEIPCKPVRGIYYSENIKSLLVIDKENGGKADAINAGINLASNPLVLVIDADSILERDSLLKITRPFMESDHVKAVGGIVRVANGSVIEKGFLKEARLPKSWLAKFQIVEYLRAFHFGRSGFDAINSMMIISGAFGCFKRDAVVEVGGFRTNAIGEDMDIVLKIHRYLRKNDPKVRVTYIPDPVCWTEAPEELKSLGKQRKRWQKGLFECILNHKPLFMNPKYGFLGLFGFPYYAIFELIGPMIEVIGILFFIISLIFNLISFQFTVAFLSVTILYGLILSILGILLEEMTYKRYPKLKSFFTLILSAILENFGYRQINSYWRFAGMLDFIRGKRNWDMVIKKGFDQKK